MRDVVEITGLEVLRQRFAALAAAKDLGPTLRAEAEAEAVAAEARATLAASSAGAALARSIEVVEIGQGDRLGYAVGTAAPAGHFLEFAPRGCARRPGLARCSMLVYRQLCKPSEMCSPWLAERVAAAFDFRQELNLCMGAAEPHMSG